MKKGKRLSLLCLAVSVLFFGYYIVEALFVGFFYSLLWIWAAGGVFFLLLAALFWKFGRIPIPKRLKIILWGLILALLVPVAVAEGLILSQMQAHGTPGLDYIVVLGAHVKNGRPSNALRWRIDSAEDYLLENPGTVAILSGGQGANEAISEAACMYGVLTERGIDPSRLLLEDKSTDTNQNIRNSLLLMEDGASFAVVTNNFHVYRASRIATHITGREIGGISAPFKNGMALHYHVREIIGIYVEILEGNMAF